MVFTAAFATVRDMEVTKRLDVVIRCEACGYSTHKRGRLKNRLEIDIAKGAAIRTGTIIITGSIRAPERTSTGLWQLWWSRSWQTWC